MGLEDKIRSMVMIPSARVSFRQDGCDSDPESGPFDWVNGTTTWLLIS